MPEGELEIEIKVENMKEMLDIVDNCPVEIRQTLYKSFQRTASKVEKELKSVTGFTDRTGKLRRSFYADATYNPLGIIFGSLDPKAIFVAYSHGTWPGNWWETFKKRTVPQVIDRVRRGIERAVRKFNSIKT